MRTGNEPLQARSPLRIRFGLALWGMVWAIAGTVVFVLAGRPEWAAACAVLTAITATDLTLVIRHMHQGPHYQPGKEIPPYEPDHGRNDVRRRADPADHQHGTGPWGRP